MNDFIKRFYLFTYKSLSLAFFTILLAIVLGYSSIVIFYLLSNSWGTPVSLSPSQPKVLNFQPQVSSLVLNINRQKAELKTALVVKQNILEQLINIDTVAIKMEEAILVEKRQTNNTSIALANLVRSKQNNITQSEEALAELNTLNSQIDSELAARLITSDQAAQRKISIQSTKNSFTELEVGKAQLSAQSTQLKDYSVTLGGKNRSLAALVPTKQLMELEALKSQLKLQLLTSEQNVEIVRKSMAADNRILQVAMDSPYYRALWHTTPVLFIPYNNLNNVTLNTPIYHCRFQIVWCRQVGTIEKVFEAEEYAKHPLFRIDLKGRFATIILTDKSATESQVLFIGSKPLFL